MSETNETKISEEMVEEELKRQQTQFKKPAWQPEDIAKVPHGMPSYGGQE